MANRKTYKSEAFAALHETMADLYEVEVIDKKTMRDFDNTCLTQIQDFSAESIRHLREREQVSQEVFARYLNISKDAVSKWEQGKKRPQGASLKLLSLVESKGLQAIA